MPEEHSQRSQWQVLRSLHGKALREHIWAYYKLPIFAVLIVLYLIGYGVYRHATHRETVLYAALVNVTAGDELAGHLTAGFLDYLSLPANKNEITLLNGLPLTRSEQVDQQYAYASRLKLMAMLEARQLDVVLMDAEARDAFVQSDHLLDLRALLAEAAPDAEAQLADYFTDGGLCLDASFAPCIRQAGFGAPVYLGVVANTPRAGQAAAYLRFLQE